MQKWVYILCRSSFQSDALSLASASSYFGPPGRNEKLICFPQVIKPQGITLHRSCSSIAEIGFPKFAVRVSLWSRHLQFDYPLLKSSKKNNGPAHGEAFWGRGQTDECYDLLGWLGNFSSPLAWGRFHRVGKLSWPCWAWWRVSAARSSAGEFDVDVWHFEYDERKPWVWATKLVEKKFVSTWRRHSNTFQNRRPTWGLLNFN